MDRHRRESKDAGSSRDRRRSRSPVQSRNSTKNGEGEHRSRRSRSSDKIKSSKRSDDELRHKESSREKKYDDERGRNDDSTDKRKFCESNRSRGRDGSRSREVSSGGKGSSSYNIDNDRERDKTFAKKDTDNREDATVIRHASISSGSSSKRPRRSSSSSSSSIREIVAEKSQIERESAKKTGRPTDSSRDSGRKGDDGDTLQPESQKGLHRDVRHDDACTERDFKTKEIRDVDDHGREVRSRRESSTNNSDKNGDESTHRDESSRGRTDTGRAESQRKSDVREGSTREKTDRSRGTHREFSPESGERRLRDSERKDQGPSRHQYGPGGRENDFSPGSGQGGGRNWVGVGVEHNVSGNGNGNGNGGREGSGPHGSSLDMWGMGMGMDISEGGFGRKAGIIPFSPSGWDGATSTPQQGQGAGRPEGFRDDSYCGYQQHPSFPAGPNGFMGGQGGGRFGQFVSQPSSYFDKTQWGWEQQQQQQQMSMQSSGTSSQESSSSSSSSYQPVPGLSRSSGSSRQTGKSTAADTGERGGRETARGAREADRGRETGGGGGSSFKPPPPPLPPKLAASRDHGQDTSMSDAESKRRSLSMGSIDNGDRDSSRESRKSSKYSESSGQTKVRSDSTVSADAAKVKEEKEEKKEMPLKWALEDSSVPVSRRLAGCELFDRVLALRGILKSDSPPESDSPAVIPSECKEESNATLDEILASLVQPAGVKGEDGADQCLDERAAENVDDFFGSFTGGALESAASDVPKGEEEEDRDLDSETSAGGDMYGDLHGGEGEGNDGDDMYGDLGGDDGDDAVDEDEENKVVLDSVSDTAALSASTETAASLTTDCKIGPADFSKGASQAPKRDYSKAPPGVMEDVPYALQDTSFTRMNLFSKAIKGQGFSTFLLQSLTDLKKLFRKETCNRKAY